MLMYSNILFHKRAVFLIVNIRLGTLSESNIVFEENADTEDTKGIIRSFG